MSTIAVEAVPLRSLSSLSPNSPVIMRSEIVSTPTSYREIPVSVSSSSSAPVVVVEREAVVGKSYSSWSGIITVFLVIAVVAFFVLYALNPTFVQNTNANGQPDGIQNIGKIIVTAIIIGLIAALLYWAFTSTRC